MRDTKLHFTLLFGEDGGGEAAANTGETTNTVAAGRNKKAGKYDNVVFGKAPEAESAEEEQPAAESKAEEKKDRKKAFQELINGEYKDLYTEATQDIINKRFRQTKELEENEAKTKPILDVLMKKHGVNDIDALPKILEKDDSYWEEAADRAGMTTEQYRLYSRLEEENSALKAKQAEAEKQRRIDAQLKAWQDQEAEVKKTFPNFSMDAEIQNPAFQALLSSGVPVEHAYKVIHLDEITQETMKVTASLAEKKVADNIRARGSRPSEAGSKSSAGITYKNDVKALTKEDRAELARRAMRGDYIEF